MLIVVPAQDDSSNPGKPFACGLTLEKLSAHTIDEDGNQAFVKDNPLSMLRKVISPTDCLSSLGCANPHAAAIFVQTHIAFLGYPSQTPH